MEFDLTFFLFAIPAVLFAGISKGGFGSGAAFAATPLLAMILEPGQAVGLMLPLLMIMDLANLKPYWRKWDWRNSKVIILGAIPGTAVGAAIYGFADPDLFRVMIGLVALGFIFYQFARHMGWLTTQTKPFRALVGGFWGFVAGITSFISHAGGPPLAIYMLTQNMSKTRFQASSVLIFWVINWLKFIPYSLLGIFTLDIFIADLILAPVAIIGAFIGVYAHRAVSERIFFGLTYILLAVTGSKLVFDGLF